MIGAFEVGFTLLWSIVLALLHRHVHAKVAEVEARLLEEVASKHQSIENTVEDAFADLQKHVSTIGNIDPLESIELQVASMKAGLMGQVLEMGVQFLGNKFGMNLGLAEYLESETDGEIDPNLTEYLE